MLRITLEQEQEAISFVLEGRLVGPWVDELRTLWQERVSEKGSPITVDLCGLTAMDTRGQRLLEEFLRYGATLRCSDVMNQFLVEQMRSAGGRLEEACRPCRRVTHPADFSATKEEAELAS